MFLIAYWISMEKGLLDIVCKYKLIHWGYKIKLFYVVLIVMF